MRKRISGQRFVVLLLITIVFGYGFGKDLALKANKKDDGRADVVSEIE